MKMHSVYFSKIKMRTVKYFQAPNLVIRNMTFSFTEGFKFYWPVADYCRFFTSQSEVQGNKSYEPIKKERNHSLSKSFVLNLFKGSMHTEQIFPFPDALTIEQKETLSILIEPVEKFFQEINDARKNDELEKIPPETMETLKEFGAFGLQVPTSYNGLGLTNTQCARLMEIVGKYDLGIAVMLGAHQSIGYKGILLYGTEEQKQKYLPELALGKKLAAFCLTESSSGSDAASIKSRAQITPDGKYYILNGSKIWISNGGLAEVMTVFAQTPLLDSDTAFIVERAFEGVSSGIPDKKMGIKCSNTADVYFDNVKIPACNILGDPGAGFKVAMNILNSGRFGMAASLSGTMKKVIQIAAQHARNRTQFGQKLMNFGIIQEKLVTMCAFHYVCESIAYNLSSNMDMGAKDMQVEAAVSKIFASEAAWICTDHAIQILGGMGYMKSIGLEKIMRDLRIFRIFEGTNDILRLFISLTGLQYASIDLREVQKAIRSLSINMSIIWEEGTKTAKRIFGLANSQLLSSFVHPKLTSEASKISKDLDKFSLIVQKLLLHYGKNIIEQQLILQCLANIIIELYGMTVSLSRVSKSLDLNLPSSDYELRLMKVICLMGCEHVKNNFKNIEFYSKKSLLSSISKIAMTACEYEGLPYCTPLGF